MEYTKLESGLTTTEVKELLFEVATKLNRVQVNELVTQIKKGMACPKCEGFARATTFTEDGIELDCFACSTCGWWG